MTSKFFSVLESYEKEQEEKMLPSPAEGQAGFQVWSPVICHPFRVSWHLLKVGKGVWQGGCPVSTTQGWD